MVSQLRLLRAFAGWDALIVVGFITALGMAVPFRLARIIILVNLLFIVGLALRQAFIALC